MSDEPRTSLPAKIQNDDHLVMIRPLLLLPDAVQRKIAALSRDFSEATEQALLDQLEEFSWDRLAVVESQGT